MGTCSSCGSTGGLSQTCATKTSDLVWDGGSLCNGWSGTSLNDGILALAQTVCGLSTEWGAFSVDSDDVALSATYSKGCFTTAVAGTLTAWVNEAVTKICALDTIISPTSGVTTLDGTLVLEYDNTTSTYDSLGTTNYGDLKSFTVPADTFNDNDEYLLIEIHTRTDYTGTLYGNAKLQITLDSQPILTKDLTSYVEKNGIRYSRIFAMPVRVSSSATNGDYHGYFTKVMQSPYVDYGTLTATTGLSFGSSMALKIRAYNTTGVVSCDLLRVTKFRKSIIY